MRLAAPHRAGRPWLERFRPFARNLQVYKWVRDYFPVSLVKTAELLATQPYIFCYHPHG